MKRILVTVATCVVASPFLWLTAQPAGASPQTLGGWDAAAMKKAVEDIGYETKELNKEPGKEKYEFKLTRDGLDIPIAIEISPSKNYIWLTVFLGAAPKPESAKNAELLKKNSEVQPCQFYVTSKGNLMLAYPLDNRSMSNAILRTKVDKLAADVGKTKDIWQ